MKLKPARIEAFLQKPDPAVATVLLYGPDAGLVGERGRRLARRIVEELADPFRVTELSADELRTDPGRLVEEAQALCFLGGRRLVRVRDAADGINAAVRQLLALTDQAGFVILEAGDLGAASSLRRAVEEARTAMAVPCYREEGRDLAATVRALLAEEGIAAEPDAMALLLESLGSDRALTRSEIGKLALYLADRPGVRATVADVMAVVGDSSALSLDDAVHAALLGDAVGLERALDRLFAAGEAPLRLLRVAAQFVMRLLRLRTELDRQPGGNVEALVDAARPPIFFRVKPVFVAALRRWSGERLVEALALLQEAEIRCKSAGGMPEAAICRAALASLCGMAAARRG